MEFFDTAMKAHGAWRSAAGCLALAMLAATGQAQATAPDRQPHQSLLHALNAARQQGCDGRPGPTTPLRENTRLSGAAALIADGSKLGDALQAAGYRSVRAVQITLQGYSGAAALAQGAVGHSCSTVTHDELAEAGFHQRGTQTWIVLAAPLLPARCCAGRRRAGAGTCPGERGPRQAPPLRQRFFRGSPPAAA